MHSMNTVDIQVLHSHLHLLPQQIHLNCFRGTQWSSLCTRSSLFLLLHLWSPVCHGDMLKPCVSSWPPSWHVRIRCKHQPALQTGASPPVWPSALGRDIDGAVRWIQRTYLAEDAAQVDHTDQVSGLLSGLHVLLGPGGVPALIIWHFSNSRV